MPSSSHELEYAATAEPWAEAVVIALGGNLSRDGKSSVYILDEALTRFASIGLRVTHRSSWWRSAAWPDAAEPPYINAVALVDTALGPADTLRALQALEGALGRTRAAINAPRVLDLDLIAYGRLVLGEPDLIVPHPRAHQRRFVMGPLAEVAPEWRHPLLGRSAEALAAAADVGRDAERLEV